MDEMDQFLQRQILTRLNREIDNLPSPASIKEMFYPVLVYTCLFSSLLTPALLIPLAFSQLLHMKIKHVDFTTLTLLE